MSPTEETSTSRKIRTELHNFRGSEHWRGLLEGWSPYADNEMEMIRSDVRGCLFSPAPVAQREGTQIEPIRCEKIVVTDI